LVTNGQEELASIAYLVTMAFVEANSAYIRDVGDFYEAELNALATAFPTVIDRIEGSRHLSAVVFHPGDAVSRFVAYLNGAGIDISAQAYKLDAPPAALTKLPLVSSHRMVEFLVSKMRESIEHL
ncbi:MAG: hypothetical protein GX620_15745, partial [Chloroflexi bacterium]|nr:hypothetical protein [Chloroflexota bacterium]